MWSLILLGILGRLINLSVKMRSVSTTSRVSTYLAGALQRKDSFIKVLVEVTVPGVRLFFIFFSYHANVGFTEVVPKELD